MRALFIPAWTVFEIAGFLRELSPESGYFCSLSRRAVFSGHPAKTLVIPALPGIPVLTSYGFGTAGMNIPLTPRDLSVAGPRSEKFSQSASKVCAW